MSNPKSQISNGQAGKYVTRNTQYAILTILCTAGLIAVVLAAVMVNSQRRIALRGIPEGFPQPIAYPDLPRWGVNVALEQYDDVALQQNLEKIRAVNFAWVRQTFPWAKIEPERGKFEWATWDRIVNALGETKLIAVLDTSPAWSQPHPPTAQPKDPPLNPADFAHFAAEFARRYGDRVDYYQIWDEPNLGDRWNGEVDAAAYAEMLRQAREAILAIDPHAVILLAGLAPTTENSRKNTSDWLYLRQLYEAGAGKYFDIASGKPYGYSTGPDDRRVSPDVLNFSHVILMREEMIAHGDAAKPLWASHFGWNALPTNWSGRPSVWGQVKPDQQASYTLGALERVEREWPWMGVMVLETWQPAAPPDDAHWGFAVAQLDGTLGQVAGAFERMSGASNMTTGYHPAAQPESIGSSTFIAGSAEFSPLEHWRFSELGADWKETGDKIKLTFRGTGLALQVRRAADRAAFYITIDGKPANALPRDNRGAFLQLIPPDIEHASVDMIPVATGLTYGLHTAEIIADRGWNQWALVGWSVQADVPTRNQSTTALAVLTVFGIVFAAGGALSARRVILGTQLTQRLCDAAHAALMAATTVTFYASAWMTWGQQIPAAFRKLDEGTSIAVALGLAAVFRFSPWLIVTLLSGLALFVLILMRLDLGLALAVLVIPFYTLPRELYDRVFSMAEIVVLMCAVAWLPRIITLARAREPVVRLPSQRLKLSAMDWATGAFLVVAVASLFIAQYEKFALREFRVIVLEPILLYMMLRTMLHSSSNQDRSRLIWRCVDALMLAGVVVAVVGLVQYAFNINLITAEEGQHRLRSVYGSPNNVGLFLGRVLPVMVAIALLGRGRRRWFYGAAVVPVALAILLSFSKGALLMGVPAALLVIGVLAGGRWLWAAVAAVGVGGVAMVPLLRTPRFQSLLDITSGTSFFRLNLWQSALLMIRDHPILGVGLDNFLYQYRGRYMLPAAWAEPNLSHPHNVILDYATRLGLLGLTAGIWLQLTFWRTALPLRKLDDPLNRALAIGLMASMADFLAHGMVDASYFVIDLAYVFFITLAVVQALQSETTRT
jgi:O-antigen ligase